MLHACGGQRSRQKGIHSKIELHSKGPGSDHFQEEVASGVLAPLIENRILDD